MIIAYNDTCNQDISFNQKSKASKITNPNFILSLNEYCIKNYSTACSQFGEKFKILGFVYTVNNSITIQKLKAGMITDREDKVINSPILNTTTTNESNFTATSKSLNFISINFSSTSVNQAELEISQLSGLSFYGMNCVKPAIKVKLVRLTIQTKYVSGTNTVGFKVKVENFDEILYYTPIIQCTLNSVNFNNCTYHQTLIDSSDPYFYIFFHNFSSSEPTNLKLRYYVGETPSSTWLNKIYSVGHQDLTGDFTQEAIPALNLIVTEWNQTCTTNSNVSIFLESATVNNVNYTNFFGICLKSNNGSQTLLGLKELTITLIKELINPCSETALTSTTQNVSSTDISIIRNSENEAHVIIVRNFLKLGKYKLNVLDTDIYFHVRNSTSKIPANIVFDKRNFYFSFGTAKTNKFWLKDAINLPLAVSGSLVFEYKDFGSSSTMQSITVNSTDVTNDSVVISSCYSVTHSFDTCENKEASVSSTSSSFSLQIEVLIVAVDNSCDDSANLKFDVDLKKCIPSCNKYLHGDLYCSNFCDYFCKGQSCPMTDKVRNGSDCTQTTCIASTFLADEKVCVSKCSDYSPHGSPYYKSGITCIDSCSNTIVYKPDDTYCESSCSQYKFIPELSKCTSDCSLFDDLPNDIEYKYVDKSSNCYSTCPVLTNGLYCVDTCCELNPGCAETFIDDANHCKTSCATNEYKNKKHYCTNYCVDDSEDPISMECYTGCSNFRDGERCFDTCDRFISGSFQYNSEGGECVDSCPINMPYYYESKKKCLNSCPFYSADNNSCLNSCNSNVYVDYTRRVCKAVCPDHHPYKLTKNRDICVTQYQSGDFIEVSGTKYSVPSNCLYIFGREETHTDASCHSACQDSTATKLTLSEAICFSICPSATPYFSSNECVAHCPSKYLLTGECVSTCSGTHIFSQTLYDLPHCLTSCVNGWLPDTANRCYDPKLINCPEPQIQVHDWCENCPPTAFFDNGLCVSECGECKRPNSNNICVSCNGIFHNNECIYSCPVGLFADHSVKCNPDCKTCVEMSLVENEGKCVASCPTEKLVRNGKCVTCSEVESYETESEKELCTSCSKFWFDEEGKCLLDCHGFEFYHSEQKYCFRCSSKYFHDNICVDKCPAGTLHYDLNRMCLDIPTNCSFDAYKCHRGSSCKIINSLPVCVCQSGTRGMLCQALDIEVNQEKDIQKVKEWTLVDQVNLTTLVNAKKLLGKQIEDIKVLESTTTLADQAATSKTVDKLTYFELVDITFKKSTDIEKDKIRWQKYAEQLEDYIKPKSKRLLQTDSSSTYQGENFSVVVGSDISSYVDMSSCTKELKKQLGLSDNTSFVYEYVAYSSEMSKELSAPSDDKFVFSYQPQVSVTIYLDNNLVSIKDMCSLDSVDVKYEVSTENLTKPINEIRGHNVNPFNENDLYFTDVCSLESGQHASTLSLRKSKYFMDPAVVCNQREGQVCVVKEFSDEGIKCECKGIKNNPSDIGSSFGTTITDSNFRLFKCYNKFFTRRMFSNPGFLLSFLTLMAFYVLEHLSHLYTLKLLKSNRFFIYLRNSMVIVGQGNFSIQDYFKAVEETRRKSSIFIKVNDESIESNKPNAEEQNSEAAKSERMKFFFNEARLPTQENSLDYLESNSEMVVKVAPTVIDFETLTIEDQILYDKRSFSQILIGKVLRMHMYLNAFFYKYLLVPMHFRLFVLMTTLLLNMALNAFFYTDELISETVKNQGSVNE